MKLNYRHEEMLFSKLRDNVVLPKFQRKLAWSKEKKSNFIDTVLNGDPCGTLLLYKNEDGLYMLVDGLQRYSTLVDFANNPSNYLDIERQYADRVEEIINTTSKLGGNEQKFKGQVVSSIKKNFSFNLKPSDMKNAFIKEFPIFNNDIAKEKISDLFYDILRDYDIEQLTVQTLVYIGDFDSLPNIFEKMNSNGTQLSKYDVFAALWYNNRYHVDDEEILLAVEDKYNDTVKNTNIDIDSYESGSVMDDKEINLYEYCVAVSRILQNTYPKMFPTTNKPKTNYDSIGFNLIAAILANRVQNKKDLPVYFAKVNSFEISTFTKQIKESVKVVNELLKQYTSTFYGENVFKYIESQMICMIATVFKIYYSYSGESIRFVKQKPDNKIIALLKANFYKRYLYDIITNHWGSSGDKKVNYEMQQDILDNRYMTSITIQYWRTSIDSWLKAQEADNKKSVPVENKLFINYIIKLSNEMFDGDKYEIDCIIPKEKIYKKIKNCKGKYSTTNLALIPVLHRNETSSSIKINDGKTLFELIWDGVNNDILIDKLLYPRREDLDFVIDIEKLNVGEWNSFLQKRRNYLIDRFCTLIKEN